MRYVSVMKARILFHNPVVAALLLLLTCLALPGARAEDLDSLFAQLQEADATEAARLEREIWNEWSKSGSPAMDLLLQRGKEAMAAGDTAAAIEHLTALTDHAPDFAEGWNARATAYFMAGDFGPSVNDIARTLTLNPRHFGALSGLGMIFEQLDQPEKALEAYRAALAIHPHLQGVIESVERLEAETAGTDL
jgi:tetratricopeptide (TPR) repeat protein